MVKQTRLKSFKFPQKKFRSKLACGRTFDNYIVVRISVLIVDVNIEKVFCIHFSHNSNLLGCVEFLLVILLYFFRLSFLHSCSTCLSLFQFPTLTLKFVSLCIFSQGYLLFRNFQNHKNHSKVLVNWCKMHQFFSLMVIEEKWITSQIDTNKSMKMEKAIWFRVADSKNKAGWKENVECINKF